MLETETLFKLEQLNNFFSTFPLIERITRHQLSLVDAKENEDITQEVKLGLWKWLHKDQKIQVPLPELLKITNRATCNKIKDFHRKKHPRTVPMEEITEEQLHYTKESQLTTKIEGNTTMELHLLVSKMWETIKTQTFFEKYALLLKNDELSLSLISYRGCRINEMAESLQLTENELGVIIEQLPLSDLDISEFLKERFQMKATPAAIRKARQRATDELQTALKEKTKQNGKPSRHGKT